MPESTPIYGFTSPCPGETITSAAFTTLANQIDAKLLEVDNDRFMALNRRNVSVPGGSAVQTIPANVNTLLTLAGSTYTIPEAGVWIVRVSVSSFGLPTVSMMRAQVRQNGTVRFEFIHNTEGDTPNPVIPFGPMVAAVGDVITTMFQFNGAGTMDVFATLDAKMIVRIP